MSIDITITKQHLLIAKILLVVLGTLVVLAGIVWAAVFILTLILEGLRLCATTFAEASTLLATMPLLHFLTLVVITCLVVRFGYRLLRATLHTLQQGLGYVI